MTREEELQQNAETGKGDGSIDDLAYRRLFSALENDRESDLSPMFADNVIAMLQQGSRIRLSRWELILLVVGAFFSIVTLIIAIIVTRFTFDFGFLKAMSDYKGLLIFGAILVLAFHWLDRRILQRTISH